MTDIAAQLLDAHFAARKPLRIHLWPVADGWQANVGESTSGGWTTATKASPIEALQQALAWRFGPVEGADLV